MKRKGIIFDLTPLLDVILILFFSVLLMNFEQVTEYISRFREAEQQRIVAEQELGLAEAELYEVSIRLEALSEWDTERLELIEALDAQVVWRSAIEEAIYVIALHVHTEDGRRLINISARPDIDETIEIIWAVDGRNIIQNTGFVSSEIDRVLHNIIAPLPNERLILIMFNEAGIAVQEFNLIIRNIELFTHANPEFTIRLSVYTQN